MTLFRQATRGEAALGVTAGIVLAELFGHPDDIADDERRVRVQVLSLLIADVLGNLRTIADNLRPPE